MGVYLQPDEFVGIENADELVAELEAVVQLRFPCLVDVRIDQQPIITSLLRPVLRRWGEIGSGALKRTTTGPFTDEILASALESGHTLTVAESASLQALCGGVPPQPQSRGSFPPPEPINDLFVRRPGWARGH